MQATLARTKEPVNPVLQTEDIVVCVLLDSQEITVKKASKENNKIVTPSRFFIRIPVD